MKNHKDIFLPWVAECSGGAVLESLPNKVEVDYVHLYPQSLNALEEIS